MLAALKCLRGFGGLRGLYLCLRGLRGFGGLRGLYLCLRGLSAFLSASLCLPLPLSCIVMCTRAACGSTNTSQREAEGGREWQREAERESIWTHISKQTWLRR